MSPSPAPEPLTLLQAFLNTHRHSDRLDKLASMSRARVWLRDHGVAPAGCSQAELDRLVEARDGLRSMLGGDQGCTGVPALPQPVLTWDFHDDQLVLTGTGRGIERFLNDIAAAIVTASLTGMWTRLRVCPDDQCGLAFWDQTRNHSAVYCSSSACANRARQRARRARIRTAQH